ncbi:RNA-directed DNA polymerase, eukaryota [Tanacetum coccineum]
METRWNRYLPKKINIFIWRVLRDRLPTRWNLSRKGIDLDSLNCPICDTSVETTNHSLWFCSLATTLWHRVFVWLDIAPPNPSNIQDVFSWLDNMRLSSAQKSALEVICGVVFWSLWHFRNKLIFDTSPPNRVTGGKKTTTFVNNLSEKPAAGMTEKVRAVLSSLAGVEEGKGVVYEGGISVLVEVIEHGVLVNGMSLWLLRSRNVVVPLDEHSTCPDVMQPRPQTDIGSTSIIGKIKLEHRFDNAFIVNNGESEKQAAN